MMRRISLALVLALTLPFAACKKGGGGDNAGGGDVKYADVDCEKMIDHLTEVMSVDATAGKSDDEVKAFKDKMKAQHPTMVAACEKEKPTKKLTEKQYACIMKASTVAEMNGCQ